MAAATAAFGEGGNLERFQDVEPLTPPSQIRTPIIAAINGHAVGVGATYALQCDMRIVAEQAKFGFMFTQRGIVSEYYSHWTLPRLVGFGKAAELLLTGRDVFGPEAAAIGLANASVPTEEVLSHAMDLARAIATNSSPAASAGTKRILWDAQHLGMEEVHDLEAVYVHWLRTLPDVAEGVTSFFEKRPPVWSTTTNDRPPSE